MKFKYLATATAVVASVSAAGAADLNKPAKVAIDYVQKCTAYGPGFFYIPGSDTCLKIGGYVYIEGLVGNGNTLYRTPTSVVYNTSSLGTGGQGRGANAFASASRADLKLDARTKTDYGDLRSYIEFHADFQTFGTAVTGTTTYGGSTSIRLDNAFIQYAGLIAGRTNSQYELNDKLNNPLSINGIQDQFGSVFSESQVNQLAYRAEFGNGVSGTISLEDPTTAAYNASLGPNNAPPTATYTRRGGSTFTYGGDNVPDIIAKLNLDQAWGSAQIAGVAHQLYGSATTPVTQWGYAGQATVRFNLPTLGPADYLFVNASIANGATGYTDWGPYSRPAGTLDLGADATYSAATGLKLTRTWEVNAAFEHNFSTQLSVDVGGGYVGTSGYAQAGLIASKYDPSAAGGGTGYGGNNEGQTEGYFNVNWKPAVGLTITPYLEARYVQYNAQTKANYTGTGYALTSGGVYDLGLRIRRDF